MPMRVGEMMVIVRAEDFASRTLRRVSGELAGLSRAQVIAAKREDLMRQMSSARHRVALAESNARRLQYVREGVTMRKQLGMQMDAMERMRNAQAKVMSKGRFRAGITPTDIRAYQDAASAVRQLGLEGAIAHRRLRAITKVIADRGAQGKGPTIANAKELRNAQRAVDALGASGAASAARFDRLNRAVTTFDQRLGRMHPSLQRAARNAGAMGDALFQNKRHLEAAYNDLNRAQRAQLAFNQAMRQMPVQRAHEIAHALGGLGRTMQLFGALGTAAFGLAAREAAQFSQAVSLAATQVTPIAAGTDVAIKKAGQLRKEILLLARDYPFAAEEMAQATYDIFSSTNVQRIDQGMQLLEAFARVGVAGQVDIQTATSASITVLNTFRGATDDVGATLNRMFAIVRFGRMRFQDFADMLPKVAAAAYGSGQSLNDVAGIMAFLTRKTGDAGIAATQISRAFDVLSRKEFRVGIEKLGVSIEDAHGKLLPLPEVLHRIMQRWGAELQSGGKGAERFIQIVTRASEQAGKGFLSTAEARRFFRFVFANFEEYEMLQKKVTKDNAEFKRSFETMMADPGVQWSIFVARMKAGIIAIGQAAIPVFGQIGGFIADMIDKWDALSEATRNNTVKWAVWISVGTLVGGILFSIVGALVSLGLMLGTAGAKIGRFALGLFGISTILGSGRTGLIGRLGLFTAMLSSIGGIVAVSVLMKAAWTGDASGIQFLMGALAGAAAGSMFGPAGMIIGGIVVPVTLLMLTETPRTAMEKAFAEFEKEQEQGLAKRSHKFFGPLRPLLPFDVETGKKEFEAQWTKLENIMNSAIPGNLGRLKKELNVVDPLIRKLFLDAFPNATKEVKSASDSWAGWEKQMTKVMGKAGFQAFKKAFGIDDDSLAAFDEQADALETSQTALADWQRNLSSTTAQARDTAVSNLRQMYTEMEDVNRQAFGQLFQGPWLTGEAFNLAKEWGITPRIQDMIKDLDMQIDQFRQRRQMIDTLFKRGLPQGFLDELQQMTPEEAMPILKELVDATPKETRKLIARLSNREKMIKDATKIDFTREITAFRKAGVDMGTAIINGFQSAGVGMWFDQWVSSTFPNVINAAVNKSIAEYVKQNPKPKIPTPPQQPKTGPAAGPNKGKGDTHDNSTNVTTTINMGDSGRTASEMEQARRAAFVLSGAVRKGLGSR